MRSDVELKDYAFMISQRVKAYAKSLNLTEALVHMKGTQDNIATLYIAMRDELNLSEEENKIVDKYFSKFMLSLAWAQKTLSRKNIRRLKQVEDQLDKDVKL